MSSTDPGPGYQDGSVGPDQPVRPDQPVHLDQPLRPDQPVHPDQSVHPDQPVQPGPPSQPGEPHHHVEPPAEHDVDQHGGRGIDEVAVVGKNDRQQQGENKAQHAEMPSQAAPGMRRARRPGQPLAPACIRHLDGTGIEALKRRHDTRPVQPGFAGAAPVDRGHIERLQRRVARNHALPPLLRRRGQRPGLHVNDSLVFETGADGEMLCRCGVKPEQRKHQRLHCDRDPEANRDIGDGLDQRHRARLPDHYFGFNATAHGSLNSA